jgi:hypothetical protein
MGVLTGQIRKDDPRGKNAWPKPPLLAVIIWRPVPPIDAHQSVAILLASSSAFVQVESHHMKYISTRGGMQPQSFSDILLMGLAPDGGLALPESYPQISRSQLDAWRGLSYAELAFEIIRLFATDIPEADLKDIVSRTYTAAVFGSEAITPVKRLSDGLVILELSNGPTLAFKDMAMQLLGNLFEYVLAKKASRSTSWVPPPATPAAPPNMPCAASRASACSCSARMA